MAAVWIVWAATTVSARLDTWGNAVRGMSMNACPTLVTPVARTVASSSQTTTAANVAQDTQVQQGYCGTFCFDIDSNATL